MPKASEPSFTQFVPVTPNEADGTKVPPMVREGPHVYQGGIRVEYWQLTDEEKLKFFPERVEQETKRL